MNLSSIHEKLKDFLNRMNEAGVPIPMIRDPKTGRGSATLTFTFLSFNTALLGQVGKLSKILGDIDLTQANYLFLISLGAYLGRRLQSDSSKKTVDLQKEGE